MAKNLSPQVVSEHSPQSAPAPLELSIVMPCLNEAETLERCIFKAKSFLDSHGVHGEIVVGDNGSTDGSQEIAERCGARLVPVPVRGYGAALYHATLAAHGRYIIMADSDDSYDFSDLSPFLAKLREGYDLVMGNRFAGRVMPKAMPWKNRYIGNPILSGIGRVFFRCPAGDFHCGIRGYSAEAFRRLDLRTTGMEFASEMVIKATLMGQKIAEVPTTLHPDGRNRPPHLRPWRDGWRHLRFMLLYSPRWLFLYPGIMLVALGTGIGARLLLGPWLVFGVWLDVHTLLYAAAAILIGVQAILFALCSKVFAISEGLLPADKRVERFLRIIPLEGGLIVGLGLFLLGLASSMYAVSAWRAASFGELDPRAMLREVIPAVLAVTVGVQIVFASFFLSVLGMRRR